MLLEPQDLNLYFKLHKSLMCFVNQRLNIVPGGLSTPRQLAELPSETRVKLLDALRANLDLIDQFVTENPDNLTAEELEIIRSWRHLMHGKFCVFRELKNYTVFLSTDEIVVAYGVVMLTQSVEHLVRRDLPVLIECTLLPFQGRIVFEGTMNVFNIVYGPGIRRSMNEAYSAAKETSGIITSLPMSAQLPVAEKTTKPKSKAPAKKSVASPRGQTDDKLATILFMIDSFCKLRLNSEYATLCRKLAEKLARKRPSPLLNGNPNTWASGIVRAIGWVNFLSDPSQEPYMRMGDIDAGFGISESAGAAKLSAIKKLVNLSPLSPEWTLPSMMDENPMVWNLMVNGFIIDIRRAPRDLQEEAFNQGLIPYIPADRA
jgi:hypothetical protein